MIPNKLLTFIFLFALIAFARQAIAQFEQPKRYEYDLGAFDNFFEVLSLDDKGIMLFRETDERSRDGRFWEIIRLDKDLNEVWKIKRPFGYHLNLNGYAYGGGRFFLLFRNERKSNKQLDMFEFGLNGGELDHHEIEHLFPIQLTEFEVTGSAAIYGGYYNYRPVVMHYDFEERKTKVLRAIYNNRTQLVQVKVHEDDSYSIVTTERTKDRRNTLAVKSYDPNGELSLNSILEPGDGRNFIFGRSTKSNIDNQVLAGTYSNHRTTYSRGLFIANVAEDGSQNINYYDYGELENFFSYMKARRQERVKNRILRKKVKGKTARFSYRLIVHDIIKHGDKYIMLGEAFYPKYSHYYGTGPAGSNAPFTLGSQGNLLLEGYRYTHAVVIGFDEKGKLLWDNSFEITDVLSPSVDQFVNASVQDDKIVLLYLHENVVRSKIIQSDSVLEGKSFNDIKLKFEDDIVNDNNTNVGGLEKWHDKYFFAYGVQRIKNLRNMGVKLNRRVFFVNKLSYK